MPNTIKELQMNISELIEKSKNKVCPMEVIMMLEGLKTVYLADVINALNENGYKKS